MDGCEFCITHCKTQFHIGYMLSIIILMCVALWTLMVITWFLTKLVSTVKEGKSKPGETEKKIDSEDLLIIGRYSAVIISALSLVLVAVITGLILIIKV